MTAPTPDRRHHQRRADDRRAGDHDFDVRAALVSVAAVVFVIGAAVLGSTIADRLNRGPDSRSATTRSAVAAAQSVENGERLCDIATALSKVVLAFSTTDELTDDQQVALDELEVVADDCVHQTTTTTGEP